MKSGCTYVKVNHFEKELLVIPEKEYFPCPGANKYKFIF